MHKEEGERDLPEIIIRLMGDKWYYFYSFSAGILEILIALAYYLFSCNMLYHVLISIFREFYLGGAIYLLLCR